MYADLDDPTDTYPSAVDYRRNHYQYGGDGKVMSLGAEPAVYVRHYVHTAQNGEQYDFVQFWMYESASTLPACEGSALDADVCHEGDWEFFQVVVRLDVDSQTTIPQSASYSMHYYGVSLPWDGPDDRQVHNVGNRPQIYVACGAHAVYPRAGSWDTPDWDDVAWNFGVITDWYDQMYVNQPSGYYDTTGAAQQSVELVPLEEYALWLGHWGQLDCLWYVPGTADDGPSSPMYRTGAGRNMYQDPVGYHNSDNIRSENCSQVPP